MKRIWLGWRWPSDVLNHIEMELIQAFRKMNFTLGSSEIRDGSNLFDRGSSGGREAAAFYESEVEGLGRAFLVKLRQGVEEIKKHPAASRIIRGDFRRHLLSRFPYGIIFQIHENEIFVAAIMHLRRRPHYWEHRQEDRQGQQGG